MNRMVSRRKYTSMTMMMIVLLFMFQFTQVIKDVDNDYSVNEFAGESEFGRTSAWRTNSNASVLMEGTYVAFLGDITEQLGSIVKQWCIYTKRDMEVFTTVEELKGVGDNPPEVLLIDSRFVDFGKETSTLTQLAKEGISMIFCNLPDVKVISKNGKLRELLGIKSVEAFNVKVSGIKLFSGFLLGGETIYAVENERDEKRQDLDLEMPWYVAFGGTKTYMVGMLEEEAIEEEELKNEHLPAIIWRNSYKSAKIFSVNGDYMYDSTGIGILNAMMSELKQYEIYPIINAQNLTIANFPGFAEENTEEIMRLYSRNQGDLFRDIMWPSINATMKRNQLEETVFFMAQADYADNNEPQEDEYVFYLKELNEQNAEAGVSINSRAEDISIAEKMNRDSVFYEKANNGYVFTAAYADDAKYVGELKGILAREPALQKVKTIIQRYDAGSPIVSYLSSDITLQNTISDGVYYTYSQDLRMKSIQTALGYSNTLLDMYPIAWPERVDDVWERMYDDYSRNINTFWKMFHYFDNTTASESDRRVRQFLGMDYENVCKDNRIYLKVDELKGDAWFTLLTNGQKVSEVEGAQVIQMEEDAYLIYTTEANVEIQLQDINAPYYYPQQ